MHLAIYIVITLLLLYALARGQISQMAAFFTAAGFAVLCAASGHKLTPEASDANLSTSPRVGGQPTKYAFIYTLIDRREIPNFILSANSLRETLVDNPARPEIVCLLNRDFTAATNDLERFADKIILISNPGAMAKYSALKLDYTKMLLIPNTTLFLEDVSELFTLDAPAGDELMTIIEPDAALFEEIKSLHTSDPFKTFHNELSKLHPATKWDQIPSEYCRNILSNMGDDTKCYYWPVPPQIDSPRKGPPLLYTWLELWAAFIARQPRFKDYLEVQVEYSGCEKHGYRFTDSKYLAILPDRVIKECFIISSTTIIEEAEPADRIVEIRQLDGENSDTTVGEDQWTCLRKIITPARTIFHHLAIQVKQKTS